VVRPEKCAAGIPTKRSPGMNRADFFTDDDLPAAAAKIEKAFERLFAHAMNGGDIVWPGYGIGTGLANLQASAPRIWQYIEDRRIRLEQTCDAYRHGVKQYGATNWR
jgi:hypothetical protein